MPVKFQCKNCGKTVTESLNSIELGQVTPKKCPECKRRLARTTFGRVFVERKELGVET